jgi:hypothetical protein
MPDWIPDSETARDNLLTTYVDYLTPNFAALGVSVTKKDAFLSLVAGYTTARAAKNTYEAQGAPIYQTYRDALEALVAEWRTLTGEIMSRRETTPAQRASLGLPPLDTTPTTAGPPASKPVIIKVDGSQRLIHIVHWVDENTPGSKAKPAGVKRAILLLKIGAAPTGPTDMQEVAADTATPYLYSFAVADAGKTAHWAVCWENSSGQRGPCSAATSWTIAG